VNPREGNVFLSTSACCWFQLLTSWRISQECVSIPVQAEKAQLALYAFLETKIL